MIYMYVYVLMVLLVVGNRQVRNIYEASAFADLARRNAHLRRLEAGGLDLVQSYRSLLEHGAASPPLTLAFRWFASPGANWGHMEHGTVTSGKDIHAPGLASQS